MTTHTITSQSPGNVATAGQNGDTYVLDNSANLNIIGMSGGTVMTFGTNNYVEQDFAGRNTVVDHGQGLRVAAESGFATSPIVLDVKMAASDLASTFGIYNTSGQVVAPTVGSDHHGGTLITAGNVSIDLIRDAVVRPGQILGV